MHGGLELVREEAHTLDFNRTASTTHDARKDRDDDIVHTEARRNVIEFDANRKPKRGREKGSESARSANEKTKNARAES